MRFFRIPAFTGIETHRDDADRGSLRVVEGCLPHGPGGLRSGPVWSNKGSVDLFSDSEENHLTAADDGNGNSMLFVSRLDEVHDMAIMSAEHTEVSIFSQTYSVVNPVEVYEEGEAILTPVGNRLFAFGDGDGEAVFVGKGPPAVKDTKVFPDATLYSQEFSRFPDCKFFVQGPKKTIFAAGNPKRPLTVYVSEPAGKSKPHRDSPYSTEKPTGDAYVGQLSTVDILMSNATEITALSSRGDQIVVHTDKGCHILYAPSSNQASTGYRVEQVAATNFSAAVNTQVVAGEAGSMSFWLGHDGQIYKDESASRGAEDAKSFTDPDQASWKSKGLWEKELPVDLSESFSAYDRESGMYWLFVRSDEHDFAQVSELPGRTILLEALPEIPGEVLNLDVIGELVEEVQNLTALPDLPGRVLNLEQLPPPGLVENLTALPDIPGKSENFTSKPDVPGKPIFTSVLPDGPEEILNLTAEPDVPGKPENLASKPPISGGVTGLTALPDIPGRVEGLDTEPEQPGRVLVLDAKPDIPGKPASVTAKPELPGKPGTITALPDLPGKPNNLLASLSPPGRVLSLEALPDLPGQSLSLTAEPDAFDSSPYALDDALVLSAPTELVVDSITDFDNLTFDRWFGVAGASVYTTREECINGFNTDPQHMATFWPGAATRRSKTAASYWKDPTLWGLIYVGAKYEGLRDSTDLNIITASDGQAVVWWNNDDSNVGFNSGQHHSWSLRFRHPNITDENTKGIIWLYFDITLQQYRVVVGMEMQQLVPLKPSSVTKFIYNANNSVTGTYGYHRTGFLDKVDNYPESSISGNPFGAYGGTFHGVDGLLSEGGTEKRYVYVGTDALDTTLPTSGPGNCHNAITTLVTPFGNHRINLIEGTICP